MPPPPGSLRGLAAALGKLEKAVDSTDDEPTPDAEAGFEEAQAAMSRTLPAWETLKTEELAALNARLQQAGQPAIVLVP